MICAYVTVKYANYRGSHATNSNQSTQRHKVEINACKNKLKRKGKIKMVKSNNKANLNLNKANLELKTYLSLETSLAPEKTNFNLEKTILNPDIKMYLAPE